MKKFFGLMFAVVAIVGFTACESNFEGETNTPVVNGVREFVASFDETRTALADLNVVWSEGDKISVNDSVFELVEGAGSTVARFVLVEGNNPVVAPFTAVYPANATSLAANVAEGTFANGANIAVAVGEDTNLIFNNVLSVLKFQVPQNCSNITVEATQPVLGDFTVNADGTITAAGNGSKTISLDGNFVTGKTYYTTLFPQTTGLVIRIDGYLSSEKDSKAMNGNKIYNLNTLPAPKKSEYGVVGTFQGWDVAEGKPVAMYTEGDWVVARGIELYKDDAIKIVKGSSWDVNFGLSAEGVVELDKEVSVNQGGQNMKVAKNGKFNIYFNASKPMFKYECVEEYTNLKVDITIDNKANWNPLKITLKDGNTVIADNATVTNNKYQVSGEYIGKTLSCQLFSGTKKSEAMNVAITRTGATVTLEETIIKLKVQLDTDNAKAWWGNTMKIHVWETDTSFDTSWPGHAMTSEGNHTWSIIVPSELVGKNIKYLVHNGNGWQSKDSTVTIKAEGNTIKGSSIGIN